MRADCKSARTKRKRTLIIDGTIADDCNAVLQSGQELLRGESLHHVEVEVACCSATRRTALRSDAPVVRSIVHDVAVLHDNALTAIHIACHKLDGVALSDFGRQGVFGQKQVAYGVVGTIGIAIVIGVFVPRCRACRNR